MLGSILSAGANIIGGLIGARSSENAKDATVAQTEADRAQQREFAQMGIRWRVEDAKAAGIHPLYALGAQIPTYSPSGIHLEGDNSLGAGIAAAGQDISRGIQATRDAPARAQALELGALQLERARLENDVIRNQLASSKIALLTQAGGNPPFPGRVNEQASKAISTRPGDLSTEAAWPQPATKEFLNRDGTVSVWPSSPAKEAIEDSPYEYEHMYRNRIVPYLRGVGSDIVRAYQRTWWNPSNW